MFLFKRGIATQYREVQGHESKKFLSYFPKGIRYMEGGVATGLTKVKNINTIKNLIKIIKILL